MYGLGRKTAKKPCSREAIARTLYPPKTPSKIRNILAIPAITLVFAITAAGCDVNVNLNIIDNDEDSTTIFSRVTANGSSTQNTTELTLTFSETILGLSASNITLSGVSGVTKGTVSRSGTTYTLPITVTAGGTLSVAVAKTGYTIIGSPKTTPIYFNGSSGGTVATPTATPAAGAVTSGTTVTLSTTETGATIYYTMNGSNPTTSSTQYTGPITINAAMTIKAIAVKSGMTNSGVLTAAYTISGSAFVAVTGITGVPTTGTVGTGLTLTGTVAPTSATNKTIVWSVTNASTTGATISGSTLTTTAAGTVTVRATITNGTAVGTPYTQDFSITINPADSFVAVTNITGITTTGTKGAEITLNGTVEPGTATNQTISWAVKSPDDTVASITGGNKVTATEPGTLVVTATIANGIAAGTDYTQDFTIAISGTVATPTATPGAGAVNSGATVALATTTPGATIHYTTNGDTPTASSATYSSSNPIPITAPITIKAIAVKTNCTDSNVLTAAYTVNVTFNSVTANGSATTTATTQLTLTFSAAISGLSAADISLSNTSIVKGTLGAATGSGPVTYTLPISDFTEQETLTVTIGTKTGYNITNNPAGAKTVVIYYPTETATITIDFADLEDEDLDIGTIALSTSNSSETITLTTPDQYTSIYWYVNNGSLKTGNSSPIILDKSDYSNGTYVLTVEVVKGGNHYTNTIDFTVGP